MALFDNAQGKWKLTETSGTRFDDTANNNDLTDNNTVTSATGHSGTANAAAQFTSANAEYLSISDASQSGLDITGDMSFSIWFELDSLGVIKYLVSKWHSTGNNRSYRFFITTSNTLQFSISPDGTGTNQKIIIGGTTLTTGVYYHAVARYNGTNIEIFLGGSSDATPVAHSTGIFNGNAAFEIGSIFAGIQTHNGKGDDGVIWNRAISTGEITELSNLYDNFAASVTITDGLLSSTGSLIGIPSLGVSINNGTLTSTGLIVGTQVDYVPFGFDDNFDRGDSATVGNPPSEGAWTEENADYWEILGNKCRGTASGAARQFNQLLRPGSEDFYNGIVRVDFEYITNIDGEPQVHGRAQDSGNRDFYVCLLNTSNVFQIRAFLNNTQQPLIDSETITAPSTSVNYRIEMEMVGTTITGRLYNLDSDTLISTVTGTSSEITSAGKSGLSKHQNGIIDYDNFHSGPQDVFIWNSDIASVSSLIGNVAIGIAISDGLLSSAGALIGNFEEGVLITDGLLTSTNALIGNPAIGVNILNSILESIGTLEGQHIPNVAPGELSLLERFDGTLSAWTLDQTGGTVSIQVLDNDEKMELDDTSGSTNVSATRGFVEPTNKYIVEADMYCETGAVGVLELLDSSDNVIISLENDENNALEGRFDTDNAAPTSFDWPVATYKMVVLSIDPAGNTARAWYTTGTGSTPSEWESVSVAKSYTGAPITQIRFRTDNTNTGKVRIDEVKIYRASMFCLGDSNTAGYSPAGDPRWSPHPAHAARQGVDEDETHSFPYRIGQKYSPIKWMANRGTGSDETADMDSRVQTDVIDQGAITCSVMGGTNDIINGVGAATIQSNISAIVSKLTAGGVSVILCSIPPVDNWITGQNTKRDTVNSWIASQANGDNIKFADVYLAVRHSTDPDLRNPAYADSSNAHFSNAGHQAIADTIYAVLDVSIADGLMASAGSLVGQGAAGAFHGTSDLNAVGELVGAYEDATWGMLLGRSRNRIVAA